MRRILVWCFLLCACLPEWLQAARVDTLRVYSPAMRKSVPTVVVSPDAQSGPLPVVYLLHGFSDSYKKGWIGRVEGISSYADQYGCLLVMPDGGFNSWYFDSPVDSTCRYETFVSRELVSYIDSHYPTQDSPKGRAIAGNSMGGHGALYLSFRHPDVFGAAGSMSGGVNLCPFADSFDIARRLGSYQEFPERWQANSLFYMIDRMEGVFPVFMVDCGTEDFFYRENCLFHDKLLQLHVPHEFVVRPGEHNWNYWSIALQGQMLFFHRFFSVREQ